MLVVKFEIAGMEVTALNGGPRFTFSEAFSFVVSCDNQAERQIVPKQMGKLMSQKDPQKANRVMQALLQMKKLDIAKLEQAAEDKMAVSR